MFRPLFLEHFRMMVRSGLARSRVQPFLENKSGCELRATSYGQTDGQVCSKLRGSKLEAPIELREAFGEKPGL